MELRKDFLCGLPMEMKSKERDNREQHGRQQDKDPISCHLMIQIRISLQDASLEDASLQDASLSLSFQDAELSNI
jgi:hypothetical protein